MRRNLEIARSVQEATLAAEAALDEAVKAQLHLASKVFEHKNLPAPSGTSGQMDIDIVHRVTNGLLVVCDYAIVRGDRSASAVGWTRFFGMIASIMSSMIVPLEYTDVEYKQLAIDMIALGFLIFIDSRRNSLWVIWITAFQRLSVAVHPFRFWTTGILPVGYMFALRFMIYPMLGFLAYATRKHRKHSEVNAERT